MKAIDAPNALCPLRPGDRCTLCVPGATGPADCPTVAMVMADPDLRARLRELQAAHRAEQRRSEGHLSG